MAKNKEPRELNTETPVPAFVAIPAEVPPVDVKAGEAAELEETRKRRLYLLLLLVLLLLCGCLTVFIARNIFSGSKPQTPLENIPVVNQVISYPPSAQTTILGVSQPVAVAVSPDAQRVYVAESGGERMIKMFDRAGNLIKSFAAPGTTSSNRNPMYMAVAPDGRLFVVDRTAYAIEIFSPDGELQDAIISQDMTFSKAIARHLRIKGALPAGTTVGMNPDSRTISFTVPGAAMSAIAFPLFTNYWNPVSVRFAPNGDMLYVDLTPGAHNVHVVPASMVSREGLAAYDGTKVLIFGKQGTGSGELYFPQTALQSSKGDYYVADGNNNRIVKFTADGVYATFFGYGSGDAGLNRVRGTWIDGKDHLLAADAVGSVVRVYDVSGDQPQFLYLFGLPGTDPNALNFPTDVCADGTGRLYVADRGNDRVDVWSY